MTITISPAVNVLRVPSSTPSPQAWPAAARRPDTDLNQPPLPWTPDPADTGAPTPGDRDSPVRTVEFGDSWAEPSPDDLPAPRPWAVRLAYVLVEALQGRRPLGQVSGWLDRSALAVLTRQVRRRTGSAPLQLQTVHLHRTTPTIVEAVALYTGAGRRLAPLAFRMEARHGRWMCTALDVQPSTEHPAPA